MLPRPADPADAAAVAWVHEVARAAYYGAPQPLRTDPEREAMWRAVLEDRARATVTCVERRGAVVGFLSAGPPIHRDGLPPSAVELHALYVLPGHWDAGVGSALHDRFVASLPDGAVGVLDVWSGNERAIAWYRRRGWVLDGRSREGPSGTAYLGMRSAVPALSGRWGRCGRG